MPLHHLTLWKHLNESLSNELIVAGSFASTQMRYNLSGIKTVYNDIDYWYDETEDDILTQTELQSIICKFNIRRMQSACQLKSDDII